jgi:membrane protease YdiL (CAAX protease family)
MPSPESAPSWVDSPPPPAPGWYPDPAGRPQRRWWDGAGWGWYVEHHGEVQWDPLEAKPAAEPPGIPGVGIAIAGYVVGIVLSIAMAVLMWALGHPGGRWADLLASELGLWSGFVGACLLVSRKRGAGSLSRDFGLRVRPVDPGFGCAGSIVARMLAGFAIIPFAFAFRDSSESIRDAYDRVAIGGVGWLVLIFVTCVGAPLVEELFFRGLVQTRLVGRWGAVKGIGVTSLLFGAAHLTNWQGPITFVSAWAIAAAGVVLGTVRYLTGRLGTSIAVHVFFNAQVMVLLALFG